MTPTDYLPPREPLDNPAAQPPRKNGWKTLVLWVVLVCMFVAIYNLFSEKPRPGRRSTPAATAPAETGWWTLALTWGLPLGFVGLMVFYYKRATRGGQRFNAAIEPALLALAEGDNARSADLFRGVLESYRSQAAYAATLRVNLSIALERAGATDEAVSELLQAERGAGLIYGTTVRAQAAVFLARLFALRGETELASRWITDGRRRLARAGAESRTGTAALLAVAEVILRCRLGELEQARQLLQSTLRRIEAQFSVPEARLVWLVAAYLEQATASPREAGNAEKYLALVRGARPGELAYATRQWPELEAFARSSGLEAALPR